MKTVMMVLSGATTWTMKNGFPHPTGFWSEEFVGPHKKFVKAGLKVKVATPGGVRPTVDPLSLSDAYNNNGPSSVESQKAYLASNADFLNSPLKLEDVKVEEKIVAAICHGPAGFLSAHQEDGTWLFKGRRLTGFSNEEETQATFAGNAPWLLEDRLRLAGADYVLLAPWTPHVVIDGNLVTGQQLVSAGVTADAILDKIPAGGAQTA